jgi:hypothetical protein
MSDKLILEDMCIHIRIKPFFLYLRELANNLQPIIKPFPLDFPSNIKIVQGYKLPSHQTLVLRIKTKNWAAMAFSRPHTHTHQSLLLDPDPFQVLAFNKSFTFTAICTAFNPVVAAVQLFGRVLHTQERLSLKEWSNILP